ncbi:hypothetical protein QBC36DRAFT_311680 [Triangularia setosa]|uniref:Uncharacterized protein n=1 Tax=Triangularia setosa TaxID=2587417 RepID=A0AAN6W7J1_9PEZI|nr:hypothetical protein QBC36DRAFT_311680 [Podospora setosa]
MVSHQDNSDNFCHCANPSHNHVPPHNLPKAYRASDWEKDKIRVEQFLAHCDLDSQMILMVQARNTPRPDKVDWVIPTDPFPLRPPGVFNYLGKILAIIAPGVQQTSGAEALQTTLMILAVAHDAPVIDVYYEICRPVDTEEGRDKLRASGLAWARPLITDNGRCWRSITEEREHLEVCAAFPVRITGTPEGVHALSYHILTKVRQHNAMIVKLSIELSRDFTRD